MIATGSRSDHVDVRNVEPLARRFTYLQKLRPKAWYGHLFGGGPADLSGPFDLASADTPVDIPDSRG